MPFPPGPTTSQRAGQWMAERAAPSPGVRQEATPRWCISTADGVTNRTAGHSLWLQTAENDRAEIAKGANRTDREWRSWLGKRARAKGSWWPAQCPQHRPAQEESWSLHPSPAAGSALAHPQALHTTQFRLQVSGQSLTGC